MKYETLSTPDVEGAAAEGAYAGLVAVPEGYAAEPGRSWPVLIFLHGSGERGGDLERVRLHGPWEYVEANKVPMIVAAPHCPPGERWEAARMSAFLDAVLERYRVDVERIYVTGLSLGGQGAYRLGAARAEDVAAVVPICGRGTTQPEVAALAGLPLWVFHGDADTIVPLSESERQVAALGEAGGSPRLTVYAGVGHDSWTQTYNDPELYAWLLEQRRVAPAK